MIIFLQIQVIMTNLCAVNSVVGVQGYGLALHVLAANLDRWSDNDQWQCWPLLWLKIKTFYQNWWRTTQRRQPWWKATPPTVAESVGERGLLQLRKVLFSQNNQIITIGWMRLLSSPFERFVGEAKTEIRIQGIKKENDIPGTGSAFGQLKCLMKQDNVTTRSSWPSKALSWPSRQRWTTSKALSWPSRQIWWPTKALSWPSIQIWSLTKALSWNDHPDLEVLLTENPAMEGEKLSGQNDPTFFAHMTNCLKSAIYNQADMVNIAERDLITIETIGW